MEQNIILRESHPLPNNEANIRGRPFAVVMQWSQLLPIYVHILYNLHASIFLLNLTVLDPTEILAIGTSIRLTRG